MTYIPLQKAVDITEKEDEKQISNLRERIFDLEKKTKNIDAISNFMMWVAGVVLIGFFFSLVLISLDYFKYNQERYEKLMASVKTVEDNTAKNSELDILKILENGDSKILNC